jgi:hypothetical protein
MYFYKIKLFLCYENNLKIYVLISIIDENKIIFDKKLYTFNTNKKMYFEMKNFNNKMELNIIGMMSGTSATV